MMLAGALGGGTTMAIVVPNPAQGIDTLEMDRSSLGFLQGTGRGHPVVW